MSARVEACPVTWDVEGWVKAALRNWARCHEEVEVVGHSAEGGERWLELWVDGQELATVLIIRKN